MIIIGEEKIMVRLGISLQGNLDNIWRILIERSLKYLEMSRKDW